MVNALPEPTVTARNQVSTSLHGCGSHQDWLDAFQAALAYGVRSVGHACPCCGASELQLRVTVTTPQSVRGTAHFWCDRCLWGLLPNACPIDEQLSPFFTSEFDPPDYRIVQP